MEGEISGEAQPTFLALPAFIAQKVTLGGLMQLASAFSRVVNTLSWFIFNYHNLVELGAATTRLAQFVQALKTASPAASRGLEIAEAGSDKLVLNQLRIATPGGSPLLHVPELTIAPGEHVWLRGASGIGKSTLFRTIAGLWPHAEGGIQRPPGCVFVGQQGYFPLSSLQVALSYPAHGGGQQSMPHASASQRMLEGIGPDLIGAAQPEGSDLAPYYKKLSGGQRQQLVLARLLGQSAQWVFLDEATSALDPEREHTLLEALHQAMPQATFVFLAHRAPNAPFAYRSLDLAQYRVGTA